MPDGGFLLFCHHPREGDADNARRHEDELVGISLGTDGNRAIQQRVFGSMAAAQPLPLYTVFLRGVGDTQAILKLLLHFG
jgi:hypothetical protein